MAAMALSMVAWAFSLIALHRLPLFAVQAIAASSIGVVVLISWGVTHQKPSRREGTLLLVLAVALIALAASAAPGDPKPVSWVFKLFIWLGVLAVAWTGPSYTVVLIGRTTSRWLSTTLIGAATLVMTALPVWYLLV
jgi:hypothetical protein